jgi:hypothetical protein
MTIAATSTSAGNAMDGATNRLVQTLDNAKNLTAGQLYKAISDEQAILAASNKVFSATNKNNEGVKNF